MTVISITPAVRSYYIDGTNGNNANEGRMPTNAWQTIAKLNATSFLPGDHVVFMNGSYSACITPVTSGVQGRPIVYEVYPGHTATLVHDAGGDEAIFYLNGGKHDITIDGFVMDGNYTGEWVKGYSAGARVIISNCAMSKRAKSMTGVEIGPTASYWHLFGNTMTFAEADATSGDSVWVMGHHNLIENNIFNGAIHDCLSLGGLYNVARNNNIVNTYKKPLEVGISDEVQGFNLVENNIMVGCGTTPPTFGLYAPVVQLNSRHTIVRFNIMREGYSAGVTSWCYATDGEALDVHGHRVYNNVMYGNHDGGIDLGRNQDGGVMSDNIYMNNALIGNIRSRDGAKLMQVLYKDWATGLTNYDYAVNANIVKFNNIFHTAAGSDYFYGTSDAGSDEDKTVAEMEAAYPTKVNSNLQVDPLFTNAAGNDFTLQAGSGMIGTGGHLTTAVGAGVASDRLTVADAKFFCDGYGIVDGDWIKIGAADPVQVYYVNHDGNLIVLKEARTWGNGNNVDLYKDSSGNVVMAATGLPYIGYKKYA